MKRKHLVVIKYNGGAFLMAGKKGMTHYLPALKEQAIRMVIEQGMTHSAVATTLGIRDPGRVKKWMHDYRRDGLLGLHKPKGRPRKLLGEASELERLRMENDLLKKFHTELRTAELAKRNIG
jgi:transposase-like protein